MKPSPFHQTLFRYGPAAAATALIIALSLLPAYAFRSIESSLPRVPGLDKLIHGAMYAVLTATYLHAVPLAKRAAFKTLLTISFLSILLGIAMEFCQGWLTTTRHMELFDALANAVGTIISATVARAWLSQRTPPAFHFPEAPQPPPGT